MPTPGFSQYEIEKKFLIFSCSKNSISLLKVRKAITLLYINVYLFDFDVINIDSACFCLSMRQNYSYALVKQPTSSRSQSPEISLS